MKLESSIVKNVLEEELERQKRLADSYQKRLLDYPKGSLFNRKVGDKTYYYLNYRDGGKVISKYVKGSQAEDIRELVVRRKEIEDILKSIRANIRSLERVVS